MENQELIRTVAPCGIVCGVCKNATPEKGSCVGCKNGGGAASECYHVQCCAQKQLNGCWECDAFPCDKGFFEDSDDPAFRGICIGSVMAVQELGLENYADRVVARMGQIVEYGDWRHKDPEDVRCLLCDEENTQQGHPADTR